MVKVRLHGTPEEVKAFAECLENFPLVKVLQRSEEYSDRGKSVYKRVYLDTSLKPNEAGQVTAAVWRDGKVLGNIHSPIIGVYGLLDGGIFTGKADFADMVMFAAKITVMADKLTAKLAKDQNMPLDIMKTIISDTCKEVACIMAVKKGGAE